MTKPRYERPSMVKNVVGRMNKAGLRGGLTPAEAVETLRDYRAHACAASI